MLRHAAGYMLANAGTDTRLIQAFLGHRDIGVTRRFVQNCTLSLLRLGNWGA
jgi:site-specific recombinase XerD